MPRKKRLRVGALRDAASAQDRRTAGFNLHRLFLQLYGQQKITAVGFCLLNHWAHECGTSGADFELYSRPPGLQSGKYQDLRVSSIVSIVVYGFPLALRCRWVACCFRICLGVFIIGSASCRAH